MWTLLFLYSWKVDHLQIFYADSLSFHHSFPVWTLTCFQSGWITPYQQFPREKFTEEFSFHWEICSNHFTERLEHMEMISLYKLEKCGAAACSCVTAAKQHRIKVRFVSSDQHNKHSLDTVVLCLRLWSHDSDDINFRGEAKIWFYVVSSPPSPAPLQPPGSRLLAAVAVFPAAAAAFVRAGRSSGETACARRTSGESHPRSSSARSRTHRSEKHGTYIWFLHVFHRKTSLISKDFLTRAGISFSSISEMKARLSAPSLADRS